MEVKIDRIRVWHILDCLERERSVEYRFGWSRKNIVDKKDHWDRLVFPNRQIILRILSSDAECRLVQFVILDENTRLSNKSHWSSDNREKSTSNTQWSRSNRRRRLSFHFDRDKHRVVSDSKHRQDQEEILARIQQPTNWSKYIVFNQCSRRFWRDKSWVCHQSYHRSSKKKSDYSIHWHQHKHQNRMAFDHSNHERFREDQMEFHNLQMKMRISLIGQMPEEEEEKVEKHLNGFFVCREEPSACWFDQWSHGSFLKWQQRKCEWLLGRTELRQLEFRRKLSQRYTERRIERW